MTKPEQGAYDAAVDHFERVLEEPALSPEVVAAVERAMVRARAFRERLESK